ncbi:MAG: oligosaccharide flippase family protein [Clostridiales bacterium]|nr:oligosaccharide flippase family protein [Clostridiales bacterium]
MVRKTSGRPNNPLKNRIKKILPSNRFARSVSILAGGTAAGQGIVILSSPLLTRLYSPEDFGLLAVYSSLLGIVGVVASLRYQLAIPLPESDEKAAHVVVLSLLVVLAVTLLTAIAVLFWGQSIAALANTPKLAGYMWLLPVGLLAMGTYQVFNYWAIRTKSFSAIARTKLTQSAGMVAVQLAGYALGPLALLVGRVFGQAAGTTTLGMLAVRNKWGAFRLVTIRGVMQAAVRYKRFPIYSTWGGMLNTAGAQLPPLLFAAFFSSSVAGIYLLTQRVLAMPMTLIGKSIADVFFSQAAQARRELTLDSLVGNIHYKLSQIVMPPALFLIIAGPQVFDFVFGENWVAAGHFAQWLAIYIYFQFVTSPLSQIVSVLEKQVQGSVFQFILFCAQISGLMAGVWYGLPMVSVALFSVASAICYFGFLVWILYITENTWATLWMSTVKAAGWSVLLLSPLALYYFPGKNEYTELVPMFLCACLVAARYLFLFRQA